MVLRKAVFAGQFYRRRFEDLDKQIVECFNSKIGPGALPVTRDEHKIVSGIIVPHAGYTFSGPAAAWAYKEIAESRFPERYIIIGPNHSSLATSAVSTTLAEWETPFGKIHCDQGFARELMKKCDFVKDDYKAHENEHSIEVQLPFLQYANKDYLNEIKIVPLIMSEYNWDICVQLADVIADISEDVVIIASSDFTHIGPNYSYIPFLSQQKDKMYALDGEAIELIKKMQTQKFLNLVMQKRMTICGTGAIATTMELMRNLGLKQGFLLNYYTSGDIVNDYTNAVGYAAIKF